MAVQDAIKITENGVLDNEKIVEIQRHIETFTKENEFFDQFCSHASHAKGTKTWSFRRAVAPIVKPDDVKPSAEAVAPRPMGIGVKTFQRTVEVYRDKVRYTAEDILFGYDDLVKLAGDTLADATTQKLDYIKGKPFITSRATATYATSHLATLSKIAIQFGRQNHCRPWSNGKYLCMATPEVLALIRAEIEAKGVAMTESMKGQIENGYVGEYGRWIFVECPSDLFVKNSSTHYVVCLAKRPDGSMPVVVTTMNGVEVIHNPLGSGVLEDVDGKLTSDDNRQIGSIAVNIEGLGADVNDDLCIIRYEASATLEEYPLAKNDTLVASATGYAPASLAVTFKVVNASGSDIASPTINLYKGENSSGTQVSASSGVYSLEPATYYYSIVKNGYTTKTGLIKINEGDLVNRAREYVMELATA